MVKTALPFEATSFFTCDVPGCRIKKEGKESTTTAGVPPAERMHPECVQSVPGAIGQSKQLHSY